MDNHRRYKEGLAAAEEYYDLDTAEEQLGNWNAVTEDTANAYRRGFLMGKVLQQLACYHMRLIEGELSIAQLMDMNDGLRRVLDGIKGDSQS